MGITDPFLDLLGPPSLGAQGLPIGHYMSKKSPFGTLECPKNSIYWVNKGFFPVVTTHMKYSGPNIVILDHVVTCLGVKRPDLGLFGASKQLALLMKRPFGSFLRAQKVQKWVIDNHLVTIGQLDHNVVLGTKSGTVQDFQRGKKCPI